jgi:type 1 fimbriae regulatory protein FimB/type 1 fimbriae regulatory protein FimE
MPKPKPNLRLVRPAGNLKVGAKVVARVMPRREPNQVYRSRNHLTEPEVSRLIQAARDNRYGHRDATMILIAYRHGLRSAELVDLRRDQVNFIKATLHVRRVKNGTPSTHPLQGDELRALRQVIREAPASPYVFVSERGTPFTTAGFSAMVKRAGQVAEFGFTVTPQMLRHACGFALAEAGHDMRSLQAWLGHSSAMHTARYTKAVPDRFQSFWRAAR